MDAQGVKDALNARAEEFVTDLFPAGRKNGNNWQVGSLGGDPGQSLRIGISGAKVGVFCDFAGNDRGSNLVELYAQAKQVSFKEALHACADWLRVELGSPRAQPNHPRVTKPVVTHRAAQRPCDIYTPTDEECEEARRMSETLANDAELCARIAKSRGWNPATLRQLAIDRYLGWNDGKLAFIYDCGVKLRWRNEQGERVIRWAFGRPWIWRSVWLPEARTVYLCEGETDCISLLDAGIENEKGTLAVALPSASTFGAEWARLFDGKDVILAFDSDDAGRKATDKVSRLLGGHVQSLNQINWGGLQHAS